VRRWRSRVRAAAFSAWAQAADAAHSVDGSILAAAAGARRCFATLAVCCRVRMCPKPRRCIWCQRCIDSQPTQATAQSLRKTSARCSAVRSQAAGPDGMAPDGPAAGAAAALLCRRGVALRRPAAAQRIRWLAAAAGVAAGQGRKTEERCGPAVQLCCWQGIAQLADKVGLGSWQKDHPVTVARCPPSRAAYQKAVCCCRLKQPCQLCYRMISE
jgi:hypothetical protein